MTDVTPVPVGPAVLLLCLDALTLSSDSDAGPAGPQSPWYSEASRLLAHGRAMGWTIAHALSRRPRASGAQWIAMPGLSPQPDEPVYHREQASALSSPALQAMIAQRPRLETVVCGVSVGGSCLATAMEAVELGVRLTIVGDALWMAGQERAGVEGLLRLQGCNLTPQGLVSVTSAHTLMRSRPALRVVQGGRR